jgi:pilus assembly protein FimV
LIAKSHRWQKTVLAAAATTLLGLVSPSALALSLGRITVQSALGEPLRAEVDIPEINAEEAASLKTVVAPPSVFQAAGLEYNPAMANVKTSLQTRANGRAFIRLSSDRAINEPFVDMILEATWASGLIVRDYTMLFDPVTLKKPEPIASGPVQALSQTQAPSATRSPAPSSVATAPAKTETRTQVRPVPPKPAATPPADERTQKIRVRSGETASGIAEKILPVNVSLDQMLVALLRANPDAFTRDNVNRMKAGAVLEIPTEAQASSTPAAQATQIIVAQSRDFNDYRRKLAANAPQAQQAPADRQASGRLQAQVEDKKTEAPSPDKLTLSKSAVQGKLAEDQLAKDRAAAEASSRTAELTKNINDLGKLGVTATSEAPASPPNTAPEPVPVPAMVAVPVAAPVAVPDAPPKEPTPVAPAVAPVVAPPVAAAAAPATEPGFIDELIENPLLLAGAAGLIALLAAWGVYRMRQRKAQEQVDSAFVESHLKPESFFGASGGQSVDTHDSDRSASSMVYSPSQLVADDVDPVAEADVYLAYGRDLQAEEILREALRTQPGRIAIHQKLADILAKRNDAHGLEEVAALAFKVTDGMGAEWARICELGLGIDPNNALYQPGGLPLPPIDIPAAEEDAQLDFETNDNLDSLRDPLSPAPAAAEPVANERSDIDLDLDLDFSFEEEPARQPTQTALDDVAPSFDLPSFGHDANSLDFEIPTQTLPPSPTFPASLNDNSMDLSALDDLTSTTGALDAAIDSEEFKVQAATSFGTTKPGELTANESEEGPDADLSMLDFDLGSLSLDMNTPVAGNAHAAPVEHEDPLMTKLALAEEFSAIGDDDGARALIEEVLSEATGDMKAKAQRALNNL